MERPRDSYNVASVESDGMEEMVRALLQQQATLQGIVQMQAELRTLVQRQTEVLESKLANAGAQQGDDRLHDEVAKEGPTGLEEALHNQQTNSGHQVNAFKTHRATVDAAGMAGGSKFAPARSGASQPPKDLRSRLRIFMASPVFDSAMGVLILLNFTVIFAELELKSRSIAYEFGLRPDPVDWLSMEPIFASIERFFAATFIVELMVHVWVFRHLWEDWLQLVDMVAIILSALDTFILDPIVRLESTKALTVLRAIRVIRALRLLRFVRVLRFMALFSALRVMVQTLRKSFASLFWSMAVVTFIILATAMFMASISQGILESESLSSSTRQWVFRYYGGAFRASYSMFEATFSGKWATLLSRELIEDISPWFALFWIAYTVTVNFAVVRVISALFLKQTLDVAAIDAERVAAAKGKEREHILQTLRQIFNEGDKSHDGVLTREEFDAMMEDPQVLSKFEHLELESPELHMLYNILAEDDGVADQEEFLAGAMKLKTAVRTVDIVHLLHEQLVLKREIVFLRESVHKAVETHPARRRSAAERTSTPKTPLS